MRKQKQLSYTVKASHAAVEQMEQRRMLSAVTLTGTLIGTSGSYQNDGNTAAKALDGNLSTFFDGPTNSGDYTGLDLGTGKVVTAIGYAPRSGWASRMVGGRFQGSNTADFSSGVATLYSVTSTPKTGVLTTVSISNSTSYEYVRYLGPSGSFGNIAEVQFYGIVPAPAKLTGAVIGTVGSYQNDGNTATKALDGSLTTFFDGPDKGGDFVGLNLGSAKIISQISFAPRSGWAFRMVGGFFQGSNSADFSSGVTNLYEITTTPAQGVLTTVPVINYNAFEYVRYLSPAESFGNIAEVQFYGTTPVTGTTLENNGTLVVNGSFNSDAITVNVSGNEVSPADTLTASVDGTVNSYSLDNVVAIVVNAGAGADTVTLDGANNGPDDAETRVFTAITINGGDGDDSLTNNIQTSGGANEAVELDGGAGNDYLFDGGDGVATLVGGDGNDTMNSDGYPGLTVSIYGGDGDDTVWAEGDTAYAVYDGGSGTNTIDYAHHSFSAPGNLVDVDLADYVNVHNVILGEEPSTVMGTAGNDTIIDTYAGNEDISIIGGGGNDTINISDAGNVTIDASGSGGSNISLTQSGDVSITGGDGNDTINVLEAFNVTVNGGDGNDLITVAGSSADATDNDPDTALISGGNGNDTIYGFAEDATVDGDSGNDMIDFAGSTSLDIEGGDGNDTLTGEGGELLVDGNAGDDTISTVPIEADQYVYVSASVNGGDGNDTINTIDGDVTTVNGGDGNDTAYTDSFDTVTNVETHYVGSVNPQPLAGTVIGTAGSYRNHGTTIANAFDDDLSTYFDGPDATGDWAGLDLGSAKIATSVRYAPRVGLESRMVGGKIQASNTADFSSGVVTLFTITSTPQAGVFTTQSLTNMTAYRYYRYIGPANSYCDIADLEFDG